MSVVLPTAAADHAGAAARPGIDRLGAVALLAGLALLFGPTYWDLTMGAWRSNSQGHEGLVLAVSAWLLWRRRGEIAALPDARSAWPGTLIFGFGLLLYTAGRALEHIGIEMVALPVVVAGIAAFWKGTRGVGRAWFPLFFMLFAVPLPFSVVLALTAPLKAAVSVAATWLLSVIGYPMGRSGVVITIGQYDLLVTEACAGLQTMFTLEALGLLYAHLRNHPSAVHNAWLAVMVVPVSFASNVVRVMILALVTYHFGDEAGQGFVHGFAGMVLFGVGLVLISGVDQVLARIFRPRPA